MLRLLLVIFLLSGCTITECNPPLSYWDKCECKPDICKPSDYKPKE